MADSSVTTFERNVGGHFFQLCARIYPKTPVSVECTPFVLIVFVVGILPRESVNRDHRSNDPLFVDQRHTMCIHLCPLISS